MDFMNSQIPPPSSGVAFEILCLALFQQVWRDPYATRAGSPGQPQCGVDIVSSRSPYFAVQCKELIQQGRVKSLIKDVDAIVRRAEEYRPSLSKLIIATTLDKDAKAEQYVRGLSSARAKEGKFEVILQCWADLKALIYTHRSVLRTFYKRHYQEFLVHRSYLERGEQAHPVDHLTELLVVLREGILDHEATDLWRRSACNFLSRVCFRPTCSQRISGSTPNTISVSVEDDWLLALGREDGSVTVRRLRVDKHRDGIVDTDMATKFCPAVLLIDLSGQDREIYRDPSGNTISSVMFIGGGLRTNALRVKTKALRIFDLWIDVTDPTLSRMSVTEILGDLAHAEIGAASEQSTDSPTSESSTPLLGAERFIDIEAALEWKPEVFVALTNFNRCLELKQTGSGRFTIKALQASVQPLPLVGVPIGIRSIYNYGDPAMLALGSQSIVRIDRYMGRLLGLPENRVTDATVLGADARTLLVGYADGHIEIQRDGSRGRAILEQLKLSDTRIVAVVTDRVTGTYGAAAEDGLVAIWKDGTLHYLKTPDPPVKAMVLIDGGRKLLMLSNANVLSLWDILNAGDAAIVALETDCQVFSGPEVYADWIAMRCDECRLFVSEPPLFGASRRLILGVGRHGGLIPAGHSGSGWFGFHDRGWVNSNVKAWARCAPVMVMVSSAENDHTRADVNESFVDPDSFDIPMRCHRFRLDENGQGRHEALDLPLRQFTHIAISDDGRLCVLSDNTREVYKIDFDSSGAGKLTSLGTLDDKEREDQRHKNALYISCGALHVVSVNGDINVIDVYATDLARWIDFTAIGPDERDQFRGGHHFDAKARALYVALLTGSVVKIDLGESGPAVSERYTQPPNRFSEFNSHTILTHIGASDCGNWIVGSGNNLLFAWSRTGQLPREMPLKEPLRKLAFVPDSEFFLTLDEGGECKLWHASSATILRTIAHKARNFHIGTGGSHVAIETGVPPDVQWLKFPILGTQGSLIVALEHAEWALSAGLERER
jgi:WD40 repeat protein